MSIKLKLEGFDQLLKDIEKAGGDAEKAADSALRGSAVIMQDALKEEMQASDVPQDLINAMPPFEVENDYGSISARVGYTKGAYDPDNPSDGYKVVFLNYGTPHRTKHGKVVARGFIDRAKKKARPQMKKLQKEALDKVLKRLGK